MGASGTQGKHDLCGAAPLTRMTFSISFDGHQWNIPVESYRFTFMSMFSICSLPGMRRGSCRLGRCRQRKRVKYYTTEVKGRAGASQGLFFLILLCVSTSTQTQMSLPRFSDVR